MSKVAKGRVRVTVTFQDYDFADLAFYGRAKGYPGSNDKMVVSNMLHAIALTEMRRNALTDSQIKKYLTHNPEYTGRFLEAAQGLKKDGPPLGPSYGPTNHVTAPPAVVIPKNGASLSPADVVNHVNSLRKGTAV
jgi:hypothetical protein